MTIGTHTADHGHGGAPPMHGAPPDGEHHGEPRRGRHRWLMVAGGIAIVAAIGVFVRLRTREATAPAPGPTAVVPSSRPVPVTTVTVEPRDLPIFLDGLGTVTPLFTVNVKSQVDGRLDSVAFKEGQDVKKGDVLAQVDPRPFRIQLHMAEAAVARDEATARNAKLNLERYKTLSGQKLIPQQQADDQQALYDQSMAAVAADRAQVENARLQLDYASIKSPIDGVTGVRQVDPGNLVHASDSGGIVVITQLDPMGVIFSLPEDDLPRISAEMAKGKVLVEAWNRSGATKLGDGELALIDNQINQATATLRLKAIFPNPTRRLWPNEFVKARLLLTTQKGAIAIPSPAVLRGPQGSFVYVVDKQSQAVVRPIQVGGMQRDLTIVTKGLEPGEVVVTDGQSALRNGSIIVARTNGTGARPPTGDGGSP